MQVHVQTTRRSEAGSTFRQVAETRVKRAVAPFESRIHALTLTVADANGAKGGPDDKVCRLRVDLTGSRPPLMVVSRGPSLSGTLDDALRRVKRSLGDRVQQGHRM